MRVAIGVGLTLSLCAVAHAAPDVARLAPDDDPKCARGECRPPSSLPIDEDDPKLAFGLHLRPPVAHFDLSYRYLAVADPYGGSLPLHLVEADGYPISNYFRLGLSLAGGASTREGAFLVDFGLSVGAQYPARVTPFLDLKVAVGVLSAVIESQRLATYEVRPTIEAGIEVFVARSFHFTAAVGWAHPVYGGVNGNEIKAQIAAGMSPNYDVHNVSWDTVTVRAGFGF